MTPRATRAGWLRVLLALFVLAWGSPAAADESPLRPAGAGARDLIDRADVPLHAPPLPADYVLVRRGPLEIAYPPALEPQIRTTLAHADQDARAVAQQLGLSDPPRVHVRLVPDPDTMRDLAPPEAPPPAYAVGVAYPPAGLALVSASVPASWAAADIRKVLRHEVSHLFFAVATAQRPIPRWLSEGVAIHQAGEHDFERFKSLAVASFTGGLVPLRRLDGSFSEGPDQVNVAYAESADFVAYLMRTEGDARFGVLVSHLREGLELEEAARQTYGSSLAQLELEWRDDVDSRFLTAPLWAGTGFLWLVGVPLMLVAFLRRRARSKATLERWAREEAMRPTSPVAVIAPAILRLVPPPPPDAHEPPADTDAPTAAPTVDAGPQSDTPSEERLPTVAHEGERHTLH